MVEVAAVGAGRPKVSAEHNAFLVLVLLVWFGVVTGFGVDSYGHVRRHGLDYPLIVHFHAIAFVSYLVLFTIQVLLVRNERVDLHRRLGVWIAVLAGVMVVLGPATAVVVDAHAYAARGETPEFLAVQFIDILAFAGLTGAGLLLRGAPSAHKRLMLLGLIYISDAGFNRWLSNIVSAPFGDTPLGDFVNMYACSDALVLGLGAYDLVTRRRLHPAWIAGAVYAVALQFVALGLYLSPAWKAFSLHLIGH